MFKVFCLLCGSNCCVHVQKSHATFLKPKELQIIQMLGDENIHTLKDVAFRLGLTYSTLRLYMTQIYNKVGLRGGSQRSLLLWAFKNQEKLGIKVPFNTKENGKEEPG
jgi:DNA-binding CsgD family transcriptional regulator